MNVEQYAMSRNKERFELARSAACPEDYCRNEYRDYIIRKEKQY